MVAILAVLVISNEYSTGMIRVTLAAMPRPAGGAGRQGDPCRGLVLAAGAVAVFGSVLAGHLILPGHGFTAARGFHPVWLSYGPTLRAAVRSVLYLALIALLSLGVAVIVPGLGRIHRGRARRCCTCSRSSWRSSGTRTGSTGSSDGRRRSPG